MTALELTASAHDAIDRYADVLIAFGDDVLKHPEIGFREHRTSTKICEELRKLGFTVEEGLAVTGARARLKCAKPGPTICIMAELDGLPVPGHPLADPSNAVAHACGHNAQLAHLLGAARALVETEAAGKLAGEIVFLIVPAEEYVDLEFRAGLARHGKIEFYGGKPEMIRLGLFDDVDMAMMIHASGTPGAKPFSMCWHYNGFIAKQVNFIGRAAHAGAAPFRGVNALNAASVALHAMHVQRETFRDEDQIRVHPIITHGGNAINVVPSDVRLETFVRGATMEAIADAAGKVDRAMIAGALAVGASVEIQTLPGYLPLFNDRNFGSIFKDAASSVSGPGGWSEMSSIAACTDVGDLSHIMPVAHPSHGGCSGANHTVDWTIADPHAAYVAPAKALAATVIELLSDGAVKAKSTVAQFTPKLTRDQYLTTIRSFMSSDTFAYSAESGSIAKLPHADHH